MKQTGIKVLGQNRSASHEYFILERYEAGIELAGTEVKSLRAGRMSLKEAWCQVPVSYTHLSAQVPVTPKASAMGAGISAAKAASAAGL